MYRIDFLGAPGTGKSFIIEKILKQSGDHKIISRKKGLNLVAQENAMRYSKFYQMASKIIKLFPNQDLSHEIVNKINNKRDREFFNTFPLINDWLIFRMKESIDSDRNALDKNLYINGLVRQIIDGVNLSLHSNNELFVLMDESLSQHAPMIERTSGIVKNVDADLVIHCYCEPKNLRKNILKRESENKRIPGPEDRKTEVFLKKAIDFYFGKAAYYEDLGIKTLHINTQDNIAMNIGKILDGIHHQSPEIKTTLKSY